MTIQRTDTSPNVSPDVSPDTGRVVRSVIP